MNKIEPVTIGEGMDSFGCFSEPASEGASYYTELIDAHSGEITRLKAKIELEEKAIQELRERRPKIDEIRQKVIRSRMIYLSRRVTDSDLAVLARQISLRDLLEAVCLYVDLPVATTEAITSVKPEIMDVFSAPVGQFLCSFHDEVNPTPQPTCEEAKADED